MNAATPHRNGCWPAIPSSGKPTMHGSSPSPGRAAAHDQPEAHRDRHRLLEQPRLVEQLALDSASTTHASVSSDVAPIRSHASAPARMRPDS